MPTVAPQFQLFNSNLTCADPERPKRKSPSTQNYGLKDMTGTRVGMITVTSRGPNNRHGQARWNCVCDCGKSTLVVGFDLRHGDIKSCGCRRNAIAIQNLPDIPAHRLKSGESAARHRFRQLRNGAAKRGFTVTISFDDFHAMALKPCHYCGSPPSQYCKPGRSYGAFVSNGIDRLDPNAGYEIGNCVPCCATCNWAKLAKTVPQFAEWVACVYRRLDEWRSGYCSELPSPSDDGCCPKPPPAFGAPG